MGEQHIQGTSADDQQRVAGYIDLWWSAVEDFAGALEEVPTVGAVVVEGDASLGQPILDALAVTP